LSGKFHADPALIKDRAGPRRYMPAFRPSGLRKSAPVIEALGEIARKYEATEAQVALSWVINFHRETVVAIPGATKAHHVTGNVGSMALNLTDDELNRLDVVSRPFM
jgi:aryl-alcohol dehydrogenase-like predicted oxidoreductase